MSLRTPRPGYGPSSASKYASQSYATPRSANQYSVPSLMETPGNVTSNNNGPNPFGSSVGPSSVPQQFDFLSHPLYAELDGPPSGPPGGHLQFDRLYSQMAQFKEQLDGFVEESMRRVQSAADSQGEIKEEYKRITREVEKDVEAEKKAQHELWTAIASEREEDAEARRIQSEKERYVQSLTAQLTDVQNELNEMKKEFEVRREEKRQVAGKLKEMTKLDVPERRMLERRTGCRIGTPGDNLVSFTFNLLDPAHPLEEAFFVLSVEQRSYAVPIVEPAVAVATLQPIINELNRSRNPFKFIKQMRALLKEQISAGVRARCTLREAIETSKT